MNERAEPTTVYRLRVDIDRYRSLTHSELKEGKPVDVLGFSALFRDSKSVRSTWQPARVVWWNPEFPESDFTGLGSGIPVFSRKAVAALDVLLQPYGELLPLDFPGHELFAYKVLCVIDALDHSTSRIQYMPRFKTSIPERMVREIYAYSFFPEKIESAIVFKIPEHREDIFVTEVFARRVRESGLTGFLFQQVWPSPDRAMAQRYLERHRRRLGRRPNA